MLCTDINIILTLQKPHIPASFNMYLVINKWVIAVKVSNFSGQYLRNHWTLDMGVLGYIGIVWPKEHSHEVWSVPPVTPCIYIYIYMYMKYAYRLSSSQSVRLDQSVNTVYENNCLFWELYETNILCWVNSLIFNVTVGGTYNAPDNCFKRWSKAYLSSFVGRSYVLSFYPISGMQKNCSLQCIDWVYCAATARLFNDVVCSSAYIASND